MAFDIGIGLMSGTSGDGVDIALAKFSRRKIECIASGYLAYPNRLREEIFKASMPDGDAELICRLNADVGRFFGEAAARFCKKLKVPLGKIDFIGSHGQTIRHQPATIKGEKGSTLQIGESAEISRRTGCVVVSDFRPADIAVGGQGAPLAPVAHHAMFASKKEDRVVHNLGGIGNVTWLPKNGPLDKVSGFDTGPANMLLDLAAGHFSRGKKRYDQDGEAALKGKIDKRMFRYCMSHPFFKKKPPKSTGRETFGSGYFKILLKRFKSVGKKDFLRTLSAMAAESAVSQARKFLRVRNARWIVCGGGAFNEAVIHELKERLGAKTELSLSDEFGYGVKEVEALLMAVLAHRTLNFLPGNLPKVTGAKRSVILGKISLPS